MVLWKRIKVFDAIYVVMSMSCAVDIQRRKSGPAISYAKNVGIHTPDLLKGRMPLKNDTSYENDVSSGLAQGMQVLSITSPCLEPRTPMSNDETFYRRIDENYEKAVFPSTTW